MAPTIQSDHPEPLHNPPVNFRPDSALGLGPPLELRANTHRIRPKTVCLLSFRPFDHPNEWSKIASHLPGRTDNEIKNHWNTHIKKKLKKMGIDPVTHKPLSTITNDQTNILEQENQPIQQEKVEDKSTMIEIKAEDDNNNSNNNNNNDNNTMEMSCANNFGSTIVEVNNNGFGIDEVPLIEPHEILVQELSSTPSTSSSSSSFSSSSSSNILEDLKFLPSFDEWPLMENNNMGFGWEINNDFTSTLDFLLEDDHSDMMNNVTFDESWKFEQLL
ncbi:hypothetical protein T459_29147 [Capsicum annuum]|uniref:Uncharacterized protein n=1 Tax=Capsicum annuum TaxID=4072 RepID=A0A2G2Y4Q6_CAPAN|nr:hypothetical protein T459_29147 [Capsicum annuum]